LSGWLNENRSRDASTTLCRSFDKLRTGSAGTKKRWAKDTTLQKYGSQVYLFGVFYAAEADGGASVKAGAGQDEFGVMVAGHRAAVGVPDTSLGFIKTAAAD
jgi:hypothetical protein